MSQKPTPFDPDQHVITFLAECDNRCAALVVYGFPTPNGPVMRLKSNQPEGPTSGILKMLQGLDQTAIHAAAKALQATLSPLLSWASLDADTQAGYVQAATAAIGAAHAVSGKLLQTEAPKTPPAAS